MLYEILQMYLTNEKIVNVKISILLAIQNHIKISVILTYVIMDRAGSGQGQVVGTCECGN
jgi:hypothetical protein